MTTAPQQGATRSRRLSSTNRVLVLLCLTYAITYTDRVNVSTAAPVADLHGANFVLAQYNFVAFSMKAGEGLADGSFTPAEQVAV